MSTTTETPAQRRRRIKKAGTHQARVDRQANLVEPTEQPEQPTASPPSTRSTSSPGCSTGTSTAALSPTLWKQQRRIKARAAGKARRAGRAS